MAQSYWPFNAVDTTETQYSQLMRRLQMDGVWGDPDDATLKLTANSGLSTLLSAGYAFVRGHMYYNDAPLAVVFTAGSAQPRIDRLVLRVNPTANTITPTIIEGAPAASNPVAPALVQTDAANFDIPIARIARAASSASVAPADITDERLYAGMVFGSWKTSTRPGTGVGSAPPRIGQAGFNKTTLKAEVWTGAAWVGFADSVDPGNLSAAVPISKGGTGATERVAALNALGIYPQATAPAHAAGRIWIKTA